MTDRSFARPRNAPATFESSQLFRFVLISMLLHALLLLVFGTSPGTRSTQRGGDPWGGLDVSLRRLTPEPGAGIRLAPGDETSAPGAAILRRLEGAPATPAAPRAEKSPEVPPPPIATPPSEPSMPRDATSVEPAPPQPAEQARPAEISPLAPAAPFEAVPLNRAAPEEIDRVIAPAAPPPVPKVETVPAPLLAPKPREIQPLPAPPVTPPPVEREIAPSIEAPLREVPVPAESPPIERVAPPKIDAAPAVEPRPREMPAPPVPQPVEPAAPSKLEREIAPVIEAPREKPTPVPTPGERVAPPKIEPQIAPPVEAPAPRRAPVDTSAPTERVAPSIERVTPPPAAAPGRAPPSAPAPARSETPSEPAPRLRFGAPDPGEEIFKPRGDAAPAPDPGTAPRLDLEATRQRAREIASDGSAYRGLVPAIPAPPPVDRKSKLADAIDKAQKPDCRDAYAAMGLLAVPALVVSTVGDGGCRW